MPTYEYKCDACGEQFARVLTIKEHDTAKITCPKCSSGEVKQQLTEFIARTSRKSF